MDIREIILQALKEYSVPDVDLRPGSGIYSFLVEGSELIYRNFLSIVEAAIENIYLSNYKNIDEVSFDKLISNFLISRRIGDFARGIVRIYFAEPRDITITEAVYAATADNRRYFAKNNRVYSRSEMASFYDPTLNLYYIDILVEAEERGTTYNVNTGEIINIFNLDGVVTVTNPDPITTSAEHETNEELFNRVKNALTLRGLLNSSAIITTLFENFPSIGNITIINFGDPEMWRDEVDNIHVGGKTDIYVDMPYIANSETFQVYNGIYKSKDNKEFAVQYIDVKDIDLLAPVIITSTDQLSTWQGGSTSLYGEGLYGTYLYGNVFSDDNLIIEVKEDLTHKIEYVGSSRQFLRLWFLTGESTVKLGGFKIDSGAINTFLSSDLNRPITSDLLAKHYWQAYVILKIRVRYGDIVAIRNAVIAYLRKLKTTPPEIGDLFKYVESQVSNISLHVPFDIFKIYLWNDKYESVVIDYPLPEEILSKRNIIYLPGVDNPILGEQSIIVYG
ncbi:MAG: hypothetical protein QXP66_00860 [Candidatus Aenigmatarchaeota archaeon]